MATAQPTAPAPGDWRAAARDRMGACLESLFDEIDRLTHFDPLTRLPNRISFDLRVRELVEGATAHGGAVVLALDLDRFQLVNETLGYPAGDALLCQVADRLAALRRPGETVARSCADELMVLAPAAGPAEVAEVVERYGTALGEPFLLESETLFVASNVGAAVFPRDAADGTSLVRAALTALHQARRSSSAFRFFEPAMWTEAAERMALDRDLRRALDCGEITVAYQPQVDLASGRIVGVEALARWTHPTRGVIPPAVFVALAEENGSIGRLTDRVLDQACRDVAALRASGAALRVAVNLSARELSSADLADRVCRGLDAHGLAHATLDVEVTEGTLIRDVDESAAALAALRRRGVQVSVDDFGTGYSSLAFLRRFPLDILKIDRSFIESIDAPGGDGGAIAELIVGLGRAIGARVIAEGVESAAQIERLRGLGCDEAQGYVFSPPLAFAELEALLRAAT